jgi:hypothetical protein
MRKFHIVFLLSICSIIAQDKPDYSPKFTGYIRAWYQADYSTDQGQYLVKQARLNIAGAVNEYASYKFQVDFTRLGKLTTTTTTVNNVRVVSSASATFSDVLLDAAGIITPFQNFDITAGQFKVPFSTDNLRADQNADFVNRPLHTNLAPSIRDIGVMLTYKIKGSVGAEFNVGSFNGSGFNKTENDKSADISLRASVTPVKDFNLSVNYYTGKASGIDYSISDFGADYKLGSLFLDGEFVLKSTSATTEFKGNSYFAYAFYDFALTDSFIKNIIPGFRYEMYDPNTSADEDEIGRVTMGVTLQFAKLTFAHFRINYEKFDYKNGSVNPDKLIFEIQTRF